MIRFSTNLGEMLNRRLQQLSTLDRIAICKEQAVSLMPLLRERVHVKGLSSDSTPIGTYSEQYMKVRTGGYKNSTMAKKGKRKGEPKDSGVYTRGERKGQARARYNRSSDPTVILSLTRQMENDLTVFPYENGYAIGYANELSYEKSQWCEATYGKKIWSLSSEERNLALAIAKRFVNETL